jgi:hypothetical protein
MTGGTVVAKGPAMLTSRKIAFTLGAAALAAALLQSRSEESAQAQGSAAGGQCAVLSMAPPAAKFCNDMTSCKTFCQCACTFDSTLWGKGKDTECKRVPMSGPGLLGPDDVVSVPNPKNPFKYIIGTAKASKAALAGLERLEAHLAASENRQKYDFKVKIKRCYEPVVVDVEKECALILRSWHVIDKHPGDEALKKKWLYEGNPVVKGLTWPGATPHSSGAACDLVLVDAKGQESFDHRAGVDGTPHSSIDQRLASKMLDEEVTNSAVGGMRLNYEAWHYEWGGPTACRCKAPECADKHWPPTGRPKCD